MRLDSRLGLKPDSEMLKVSAEELQAYIIYQKCIIELRELESKYNENNGELDTKPIHLQFMTSGTHLRFDMFELLGPDFEELQMTENTVFREIKDEKSNSKFQIVPLLCARPCLLKHSTLVNDKGKVKVEYKETGEYTPTTESYPFAPDILNAEDSVLFSISREDLLYAFKVIRDEVTKMMIAPLCKATGYKWLYCRSSFKDNIYFMEFKCFQDVKSKVTASALQNSNLLKAFAKCECNSSVRIGIHVFTKACVIGYHHVPHTKLVDTVYKSLAEIYADS